MIYLDLTDPTVRTAFSAAARMHDVIAGAISLQSVRKLADGVERALDGSGLTGVDLLAAKTVAAQFGRLAGKTPQAITNEIMNAVCYGGWDDLGLPQMPAEGGPQALAWPTRVGLLHIIAGCARGIIGRKALDRAGLLSQDGAALAALAAGVGALTEAFGVPPTLEELSLVSS